MMSEMLARVADAIEAELFVPKLNLRAHAREVARLAIEAMREPTDAMRKAAYAEENRCAVLNYGAPPAADDVWGVMIEAAGAPKRKRAPPARRQSGAK